MRVPAPAKAIVYWNVTGVWAWPGRVMAFAYALIGATMMVQPERFYRTPSYANLMQIFGASTWGAFHMLVAILLVIYMVAVPQRWYAIAVHTFAVMLTGLWLAAFIIRNATDDATTMVNVASWTVFLSLLIRSGTLIDLSSAARRKGSISEPETP